MVAFSFGFDYNNGVMEQFSRTELLIGKSAVERLNQSKILIVGLGGVGGYAAEAFARAGVGTIGLCDGDRICLSNLNRQILATHRSAGAFKTDAAVERIRDINPAAITVAYKHFYTAETAELVNLAEYDYIVDAIDSVADKIELIVNAKALSVPIISCMGAGNKLNPGGFVAADIFETSVCPLAKVMRRKLKERGIEKLTVVYSKEQPIGQGLGARGQGSRETNNDELKIPLLRGGASEERASDGVVSNYQVTNTEEIESQKNGIGHSATDSAKKPFSKQIPGSISFVPPAAGLALAGYVIRDLLGL